MESFGSISARDVASSQRDQITTDVRRRILNGELAPGDLLPTIRELAARFDTSVFTVQAALTPLAEEGLIERRRRTGTIVKHQPAVLTCAGIYSATGLLDEWNYAFYRQLASELQRQLGEQNVQSKLFADLRAPADQTKPHPDLIRAIESREIQGLFVPLCDQNSMPWLKRLPVPKSFVSSAPEVHPVGADVDQMLELALTRLRDRGCRNVALISAVTVPPNAANPYFHMYEKFTDLIADLGLRIRDGWVVTPEGDVADRERYGYEAFRRLWGEPASTGTGSGKVPDKARDKARDKDDGGGAHPDGVFVYPDISARGVMTAAIELGVRVPDDVKLVFHRNRGVDWLCPLDVDWVESDVAAWAEAMVAQIRRQKAGGTIEEPTVLGYRLVEEGR